MPSAAPASSPTPPLGNFTAVKYMLSQHASFILVQETLYDENSRVLVSSKHYIPVESFKPRSTLWPDAPEGPFSFIQIMLDRKIQPAGSGPLA